MCEDHQLNEVFGIDVEVRSRPAGLHSRAQPQGQDEKGGMAGTIDEPSKTNHGEITWRDHLGSVRGGRSGGRGETRRRPGGQ